MSLPPTSRANSRTQQIRTIKKVSRRLIAEKGVAGLSLREVAREMGFVSSALYRYFASRDELLTALILDGYNDLGASVERVATRHVGAPSRERWRAAAYAIRSWAIRHPHEYALIYGTPVPGYEAPELTIEAASRVTRVLAGILNDDRRSRPARRRGLPTSSREAVLEVDTLESVMPSLVAGEYVGALMAWTQIFGFVSFELFGHYVGSVRDTGALFERVVEELADQLHFPT